MRTLAAVRNYCLIVFLLVLAFGTLLRPGQREMPASNVQQAGFGR